MKIANVYSHLNGLEFLQVHCPDLLDEIYAAIVNVDASKCIKESGDKTKKGKKVYDQKKMNQWFVEELKPNGWESVRTPYYVTGDLNLARSVVGIRDKEEQRQLIEQNGLEAFSTYNQVDFVKNRVAIEVQFGKYFSVAYDLHVKHTFFYLRNDIDVGIEIIPTKALERRMDTGVPWFENEVTNVIREGRSNPSVPIVMIGIEPEVFTI